MAAEDSAPTSWNTNAEAKFNSKRHSEYFDPCQEAAERSLRCMHRNGGDRDMCQDYFQAYRDCKKQWTEERRKARQKTSWF
ncbi:hypothetical protein EV356DRAFT_502409 [Viridothelium virens]|uniref:Uncharacterized protein n=1 Tax=Viridothelium virens TaxID=1048519 RepID=A0A6A6HNA6_VIRVR|nr:hypothetical protein EV356DRAFT_502409 [Viridothelium virens]